MKIIIAPDSLKGSLTLPEVEQEIKRGFAKTDASIESVIVPMADGGEGTGRSKVNATYGKKITVNVHDRLLWIIKSIYGIPGVGITGVIEMASASGLSLLSVQERNPIKTLHFEIFPHLKYLSK